MDDPELEAIRARLRTELTAPAAVTSGHPVDVTDDSIDAFARQHAVAVVDVWAEWCGPCRLVGPIVDQLAKEWAGSVTFGKLDADENQRTMMKYGIRGIPTLLVFRDGKLADSIVGYMPKPQLAARIQASSRSSPS